MAHHGRHAVHRRCGTPRPGAARIADLTEEKLASHLFDSCSATKIMPLSDDLIVYPNHGPAAPAAR